MEPRRRIYHKQEKRSTSRVGLMFCLLLAVGVLMVPVGSDLVHRGKVKLRDVAMKSGVLDINDCVVTPDHAIACTSGAVGTPLAVAVRQMKDTEDQLAEEKAQRLRAEGAVHQLALEVERLSNQIAQGTVNGGTVNGRTTGSFPSFVNGVTPTARTGADSPAAAKPAAPPAAGNSGDSTFTPPETN